MQSTAPVLQTQRLSLRPHRADDFHPSVTMFADPAVTRYIGGKPSTSQETWMRMLRYPGLWALLGYGYWAIEERATGTFIGEVGFADFKRDFTPSISGIPEAGWVIAPNAQGRGFATEACQAAHAWASEQIASSRAVCIIAPDNAASIRVAQNCGYREATHTTYRDQPTILFSRDFPARMQSAAP